jgi:hypothetical protein
LVSRLKEELLIVLKKEELFHFFSVVDPGPYRSAIILESRVRIKEKSGIGYGIQIHIKVKSSIRIRIKVKSGNCEGSQ